MKQKLIIRIVVKAEDERSRENHLQKLTDQAQDLDLGYHVFKCVYNVPQIRLVAINNK